MFLHCNSSAYPLYQLTADAGWQVWLVLFIPVLLLGTAFWFLPKKWKTIPAILSVLFVWYGVHDFVLDERMVRSASEIAEAGDFGDPNGFLRAQSASNSFIARPIDLGTDCHRGLIVSLEKPDGNIESSFRRAYPDHPLTAMRMERWKDELVRRCRTRSAILYPDMYRDGETFNNVGEICEMKKGELIFRTDHGEPEFGLRLSWCRELDDEYSYCEGKMVYLPLSTSEKAE